MHFLRSLKIATLVAVFTLTTFGVLLPAATTPVSAANDYPYGDLKPGQSRVDSKGNCLSDDWFFCKWECVSYAAWRINRDAGTPSAPYYFNNDFDQNGLMNFGSAGNWDNVAKEFNIPVNNTPKVGSIAEWEGIDSDGDGIQDITGHVAYVESVNADGSVNVSEYNWNYGDGKYNTRNNIRADHYIHFNNNLAPENSDREITQVEHNIPRPTTPFTLGVINPLRLYQAKREISTDSAKNNRLFTRYYTPATGWTAWVNNGPSTMSKVTMKSYKGKLYQAFRGGDDKVKTRYNNTLVPMESDNSKWKNADSTTSIKDSVSMEEHKGKLVQVARDKQGYFSYRVSSDGIIWPSRFSTIPGAVVNSDINLSVFNNVLYASFQGGAGKMYHARSLHGTDWQFFTLGGATKDEVPMVVFKNRLYQFVRGNDDRVYLFSSSNGINWSSPAKLGITTTNVTPVVFNNYLYLLYRDSSGVTMFYSRFDGVSWTHHGPIAGNVTTDISANVFMNKLHLVMRGGDDKAYRQESSNGTTWSGWRL